MRTRKRTTRPAIPRDQDVYGFYARDIARLLRNTGSGERLSAVFRDWLAVVAMTLARLPELAAQLATPGQTTLPPAPATEQGHFHRLADRYGAHWPQTHAMFAAALQVLLAAVETPTNDVSYHPPDDHPTYRDVLGSLYMLLELGEPARGQYFTPEPVGVLLAQLQMATTERLVEQRLREALLHPDNLTGQALLVGCDLCSSAEPGTPDEAVPFVLDYLVPAALPYYEPITVTDPACGSGRLLLAAAGQFPRWAVEYGLVRFLGQDSDPDCVHMARINLMLYGLNGWGLRWKVAVQQLRQRVHQEQAQQAQQAQEAAAGLRPEHVVQLALPLDEAITQRDAAQEQAA